MSILAEFERTLVGVGEKNRQRYVRSAARFLGWCSTQQSLENDLDRGQLALLLSGLDKKRMMFGRVHRFERFLRSQRVRYNPKDRQTWRALRDEAMVISAIAYPQHGLPVNWIHDVLEYSGTDLHLWGKIVNGPAKQVLLHWFLLRQRVQKPKQARVLRLPSIVSASQFLFPASDGGALDRSVFYRARKERGLGGAYLVRTLAEPEETLFF
jgi:hypothetical protein